MGGGEEERTAAGKYAAAESVWQRRACDAEKTRGNGERAARGETPRAEKYLNCDLLILDDLGTEFTNAFTVTCLYQIVNTRLTHGFSTVISTNLTPDELTGKYDERLTSRLLGAYRVLQFKGRDIRFQKLAEEL